jgi:hypothetical protein
MGKPKKTKTGRPTIFNQDVKDVGNAGDKGESLKIYGQMTGDGLVSTEQKSKGNNRRV